MPASLSWAVCLFLHFIKMRAFFEGMETETGKVEHNETRGTFWHQAYEGYLAVFTCYLGLEKLSHPRQFKESEERASLLLSMPFPLPFLPDVEHDISGDPNEAGRCPRLQGRRRPWVPLVQPRGRCNEGSS